jgi:hypothetical protein
MLLQNKYIYRWSVEGEPIYFGQGTHNRASKYKRSTELHILSNGKKSYAELKRQKHIDKFTVEILFDNLTEEEANDIEIYFISKYGRKINKSGILYNMAEGGHINPLNTEEVKLKRLASLRTDEYRDKQSKSSKDRWLSKEYRDRMADYIKGHTNLEQCVSIEYNGTTYASKSILARSLNMTLKVLNYRLENNIPLSEPKRKKIEIVYEGVEYKTARDLAKAYGRSPSYVSTNLKNGLDPIKGKNV